MLRYIGDQFRLHHEAPLLYHSMVSPLLLGIVSYIIGSCTVISFIQNGFEHAITITQIQAEEQGVRMA